jgi:hypothetical protein
MDFRRRQFLHGGLAVSTLLAIHPRPGGATGVHPSFKPQPGENV